MNDDRILWEPPSGRKLHIERKDSTNVICGKITRAWQPVAWLSNYGTDDPDVCKDCAYYYTHGER